MARAGLESTFSTLLDSRAAQFELESCTEVCDLADDLNGIGMIDPEVDAAGHIEYKLKLPTPNTPYRLAKLITQLKWRLVEGGGSALYELGVMDNGLLVGLPLEEMQESLNTLGRMLAGLGGGQVRVLRVIRVGGSPADEPMTNTLTTNRSRANGTNKPEKGDNRTTDESFVNEPPGERVRRRSSASLLFKTFSVEAVTDPAVYTITSMKADETSAPIFRPSHSTRSTPSPPRPREHSPSGIRVPHTVVSDSYIHNRTPEERALLRRQKRDARRARRKITATDRMTTGSTSEGTPTIVPPELDLGVVSIEAKSTDGSVVVLGAPCGGGVGSGGRRNSPVLNHYDATKLNHKKKQLCARTLSKMMGCPNPFKPSLVVGQKNGQERFVVEALVIKQTRQSGRKSESSDETDEVRNRFSIDKDLATDQSDTPDATTTTQSSASDDDEGLEGWGYLDFSLPKVRKGDQVDHTRLSDWIATDVSLA
ncbi:hypothetical protein OIV83_001513 [Microbotryomycetes sp. JL201]|nr:hypothetical protein OIV83_001513 [Microbotryomycetes sp. JL201]